MPNKLKIGLFCRDFENLADWEYRLFEKLFNNKNITIKIIYQKINQKKSFRLKDILFKIFVRLEHTHTYLPKLDYQIKNLVINNLNKIKLKKLRVKSSKYTDYFDKKISNEIKQDNLDLILRHDFNIIKGEVLNVTKFGIWSFHHGDTSKYRGGPSGFWEIIFNEPVTAVTLIRLNNFLDGGKVIEKAYYSTKKNFLINNFFIMDKSINLIIKNFNRLNNNQKLNFKNQNNSKIKIFKSPSFIYILKYYKILFLDIFSKILKKILKRFFRINSDVWTLTYDHSLKLDIENTFSIKQNKNQFWADPLYICHKAKEYIFFEKFDYLKGRGVISVGNLVNNELLNIRDIIKKKYHLSYPQIFNYKNNFLMSFESWQNNNCTLLKSTKFPYKWKKYKTFLKGYNAADPTFYNDGDNLWLFVNLSQGMMLDHDSELYIFLIKKNFDYLIPHKCNPVITDSRVARNAGQIFTFQNKIIRPSQINIHDKYGFGLNLREIKKLNIDEYEETTYKSFTFNKNSKFNGIHHISKSKNGFVFDRRVKYLFQ